MVARGHRPADGRGALPGQLRQRRHPVDEVVGPDRLSPLPARAPCGTTTRGPVLITYQGRLLLGDIVMQTAAEAWRVHYDGFGPEAAENVAPTASAAPSPARAGTRRRGVTVDVNGQQLAAKILAASAADHWIVRYDAFGPQYDQEVGIDRIRASPRSRPPPPPRPAPPPRRRRRSPPSRRPPPKPQPGPAPAPRRAPSVPAAPRPSAKRSS